jgi:hypothetical protein
MTDKCTQFVPMCVTSYMKWKMLMEGTGDCGIKWILKYFSSENFKTERPKEINWKRIIHMKVWRANYLKINTCSITAVSHKWIPKARCSKEYRLEMCCHEAWCKCTDISYDIHLQFSGCTEDGCHKLYWNISKYRPDHMTLHTKI